MAETTVDSGLEFDSGAMFRGIMDKGSDSAAPEGQQPAPSDGEPGLPADRGEDRRQEARSAPELTEHQRQQAGEEQPARPPGERRRDAMGRFINDDPGQPQPGAAPAAGGAPGGPDVAADGSPVPSWRLREEREAREAYATQLREAQDTNKQLITMLRQMQQPQQQAPQRAPEVELPDPVLDPRGYHQAVMAEVTGVVRMQQLDTDLRMAHARHGDLFEKAYAAFNEVAPQHPDFARSVVNGPTPGERMVEWYKRQSMMAEVGDDPRAWMTRQLEQALQNPEFLAKAIAAAQAQAQGRPAPGGQQRAPNTAYRLPPSLSRLPSGAADRSNPSDEVVETDSEHMFAHAMGAKRK